MLPYNGNPDIPDKEYYVTGTNNYTRYLVNNLCTCNNLAGLTVSLDGYFISISIAKWCLEEMISVVRSITADWKEMLLTSYVNKKTSAKKNV